jgi:hypothetical protein
MMIHVKYLHCIHHKFTLIEFLRRIWCHYGSIRSSPVKGSQTMDTCSIIPQSMIVDKNFIRQTYQLNVILPHVVW